MPLSFETQMLRVGELFCDAAVFAMPPFQRPYCWDEDTAGQLYDDISSAMLRGMPDRPARRNRQEYFLGPIIVTRGTTPNVFDVIDGQQRLVTLTILLAVIRDRLPADTVLTEELQRLIVRPEHRLRRLSVCPRVKLREGDQQRFEEWVQTRGATREVPDDPEEGDATSRILKAVERIASDVDGVQTDYLRQLASFILNNCYVIQVTARDLDDGYILFRSLNSRGQPLTNSTLRGRSS